MKPLSIYAALQADIMAWLSVYGPAAATFSKKVSDEKTALPADYYDA